jgi:hypothetical protein
MREVIMEVVTVPELLAMEGVVQRIYDSEALLYLIELL